jgi:protein SCO1
MWLAAALILLLGDLLNAEGEGSLRMPNEIMQAELEDKSGAKLPLDVMLTDQDGRVLSFGDYISSEDARPIILTLGYYGCPMLCTLVLNGLLEGLKDISFEPGKHYRILSISIDPRETSDLANRKRKNYLEAFDAKTDDNFWNFHVTNSHDAKKLADAVGFNYYYDKKTDQFAHGAGFFVVTAKGVLSRTLFGINFKSSDIKLALSEAAEGKIGSFIDRVILSCFHYDPDSHRYGVYIFGVMRLSGILTIIILGTVLLIYFRSERKRADSMV